MMVNYKKNGLYSIKIEVLSNNNTELLVRNRTYGSGAPPIDFESSKR